MKIQSLNDLFLDELKDAYDFEHQLVEALPKMAEKASDPKLQKGFEDHAEQTRGQVERLEQVFASLGEEPKRKPCKGMKGLIKEGDEVLQADGDPAAIDAALIGAAQRVEHYEMAAYGTLRSLAEALGRDKDARVLQRILDQEAKTDERLSKLAESRINKRAAANGNGRASKAGGNDRKSQGGARKAQGGGSSTRSGGDGATKEELYERAQELDVEGRSGMNKKQLEREVQRAESSR